MGVKLALNKSKVVLKEHIEINGHIYCIDGKTVVLEPSKKELNVAIWLSKKLNKKVEVLPRVLIPEGIKTSDYLIDDNNWDLKTIISNINNAVYTSIRKKEKQSNNFVIGISKSKLSIKSAIKQVMGIYSMKGFNWLNNIIIKKNDSFEIIKRK